MVGEDSQKTALFPPPAGPEDDTTQSGALSADVGQVYGSASAADAQRPLLSAPVLQDLLPRGRFKVEALVGRGAMGAVFRAYDEQLHRFVALKAQRWSSEDAVGIELLRVEARVLAGLDHPGIVRLYELLELDGFVVSVMELVDGEELGAWISQQFDFSDAYRQTAVGFMGQLCEAVALAHQRGIVHRDLKTANVMVTRAGAVKILDFGLALDSARARGGEVLAAGTPAYMAPECSLPEANVSDPRRDVFALGVIAHELFTAKKPFKGRDPASVARSVKAGRDAVCADRMGLMADVEVVVAHCLAYEPSDRYPDAQSLAADWAAIALSNPVSVRRYPWLERLVRGIHGRWPLFLASALVSLLLVVALNLAADSMYVTAERAMVSDIEDKLAIVAALAADDLSRRQQLSPDDLTRFRERLLHLDRELVAVDLVDAVAQGDWLGEVAGGWRLRPYGAVKVLRSALDAADPETGLRIRALVPLQGHLTLENRFLGLVASPERLSRDFASIETRYALVEGIAWLLGVGLVFVSAMVISARWRWRA